VNGNELVLVIPAAVALGVVGIVGYWVRRRR
jgi:hypothetical protein